jgi:hypothetical protein
VEGREEELLLRPADVLREGRAEFSVLPGTKPGGSELSSSSRRSMRSAWRVAGGGTSLRPDMREI